MPSIPGQAASASSRRTCPLPKAVSPSQSVTNAVVEDNAGAPPGSKTVVALTAPFAAGKSTAITGWAYEKHRLWTDTTTVDSVPVWELEPGMTANLVPVVHLSRVSSAGVKELNAPILGLLGYPGEGIARITTAKVTLALRRHRVRVLIVDDAHMLRPTDRTSRQCWTTSSLSTVIWDSWVGP